MIIIEYFKYQYSYQNTMINIDNIITFCSCQLSALCLCLVIVLYLFVKFIALITGGFHIIGIILIIVGLFFLLKGAGQFALYPGSFSHVKAEIQMNGSKRMSGQYSQMVSYFFDHLQYCQNHNIRDITQTPHIYNYIQGIINILCKFQTTLSPQKIRILRKFKELQNFLNDDYKDQATGQVISIRQYLTSPKKIKKQMENVDQTVKNIDKHIKMKAGTMLNQIGEILLSFRLPVDAGLCKNVLYQLYDEKLYEIRFAYSQWDKKFEYDVYQIDTSDGNTIQCAIIHSFKDKKQYQRPIIQNNKAVLLSCPNGGFIQYYVFDCRYAYFYLQMGYKIILWNYRGYGYSTGTPSLSAAVQDIQNVYNFSKNQLQIQPIILHGYSIGGPPSVHLAQKYQNNIKLVIADRTFSHVQYIARSIAPCLQHLYKWVFYSDAQIDNINAYLNIKDCNKLIIWDQNDQIIADSCSLKRETMEKFFEEKYCDVSLKSQINAKKRQQIVGSQNSMTEQLAPNISQTNSKSTELQLDDSQDQFQFTKRVKSVSEIMTALSKHLVNFFIQYSKICAADLQKQTFKLNPSKNIQKNNIEVEPMIEQDQQKMSQKIQQRYQISVFKGILTKIQNLDGGGSIIFHHHFLTHLAKLSTNDNVGVQTFLKHLHEKVTSYLHGLFQFGSYYNQQTNKLRIQSCQSIYEARIYAIKILEDASQYLNKQMVNFDTKQQNLLKKLKRTLQNIKMVIEHSLNDAKSDQLYLGMLLPTKQGHNGELKQSQFDIIRQIIEQKVGIYTKYDVPNQNMGQEEEQVKDD